MEGGGILPPKKLEELIEKKVLLESELDRLTEINIEILRMSETGMLCNEMKRTIQEYKKIIEELQHQIDR